MSSLPQSEVDTSDHLIPGIILTPIFFLNKDLARPPLDGAVLGAVISSLNKANQVLAIVPGVEALAGGGQ